MIGCLSSGSRLVEAVNSGMLAAKDNVSLRDSLRVRLEARENFMKLLACKRIYTGLKKKTRNREIPLQDDIGKKAWYSINANETLNKSSWGWHPCTIIGVCHDDYLIKRDNGGKLTMETRRIHIVE